jgi:hypothetical protein
MKAKLAVVVMLGAGAASCAVAQERAADVFFQTSGAVGGGFAGKVTRTPIVGAPYSATITNENVQVLSDGNRIVQSSTGTTARDSQGRTRQDAPLPVIGNLSAANAPHLVFINDPVGQKSYTLNLTEKTAQSMTMLPGGGGVAVGGMSVAGEGNTFFMRKLDAEAAPGQMPGPEIATQKALTVMDIGKMDTEKMAKLKAETFGEGGEVSTEDLGTQTMEGVLVEGTRTTRTIPAGEIGNEKPISIVTEVWTSPELKTVVMSKRSDPRMGEHTFQLTNIVRAEPDASLFKVPADFKIVEGPQPIQYRTRP